MRKLHYCFIIWLASCTCLHSQHQFSQYNYAQQQVNPGAIALDDFAMASLIYRSQRSIADIKLTNLLLSAKYPFIRRNGGDRWSSVGVTLGHDESGLNGLLVTDKVGASYALNFPTGKKETLSWGLQLNYHSRKFDVDKLVTGSQFIPGVGFDPNISSGEGFGGVTTNFITVGTGIIWDARIKSGERKFHAGVSAFDLNRPSEGLLGEEAKLPVTIVIEGGYRAFSNRMISIYSEFLYSTSSSARLLNLGLVTSYALGSYAPQLQGQRLEFHTKYLSNQGALLAVQWHKGPLSAGISYEIPINNRVANRGAFEIGLQIGRLIESRYKPKKAKRKVRKNGTLSKTKKPQNRRTIKENASNDVDSDHKKRKNDAPKDSVTAQNIQERVEVAETATDTTGGEHLKGKTKAGDFQYIRAEEKVYFNFNFLTGKAKIQPDDLRTLDKLVVLMITDQSLRVKIEGHTDDVGDHRFNQTLSERRATAVANYLIANGIAPDRIEHRGWGETQPLVNNIDDESRTKNRRVEFVLHRNADGRE